MCEKLSKGKVEIGLVVFGAIGLTLFGIDLYWSGISVHESLNDKYLLDYMDFVSLHHDILGNIIFTYWRLLADIALIGFFGGLYIVPLYALIQTRSEKSHQSRIIAANNIFNALFMVISAAFSIWIFKQGYNIPELFLTTAILNALVIIYLCIRQPEYLKTFVAWIKP